MVTSVPFYFATRAFSDFGLVPLVIIIVKIRYLIMVRVSVWVG